MTLRLVVDNTTLGTARSPVTVATMHPATPTDAQLYSLWFTGIAHTAWVIAALRAPDYTFDSVRRARA